LIRYNVSYKLPSGQGGFVSLYSASKNYDVIRNKVRDMVKEEISDIKIKKVKT